MERIIVGKEVVYAAKVGGGAISATDEINDLVEGAVVAFEDDGTFIDGGGSHTPSSDNFYFALGGASSKVDILSGIISRKNFVYSRSDYVAPVTQITYVGPSDDLIYTTGAFLAADVGKQFKCTTVSGGSGDFRATTTALLKIVSTGVLLAADTDLVLGTIYEIIAAGTPDTWDSGELTALSTLADLNLPSTLIVDSIASVTLIDNELSYRAPNRNDRVHYMVVTGDTDVTVITKLIALINANSKIAKYAVASITDNDGIKLTAVDAGHSFGVTPGDILQPAVVSDTIPEGGTPADIGVGSYALIAQLEQDYSMEDGANSDQYRKVPGLYTRPFTAVVGATYDMITITSHNPTPGSPSASGSPDGAVQVLTFPTSAAVADNIEALLADMAG